MDFISIPMRRVFNRNAGWVWPTHLRPAKRFLLGLGAMLFAAAFPVAAEPCQGVVYLTFDTGNMSQAELIARVLKEENVKATFFLANERSFRNDYSLDPSWDSYWRGLASEGHRFGNHTWSHLYARSDEGGKVIAVNDHGERFALDRGRFCEELSKVERAFHRATGAKLSGLWRAPGWRTTYQSMRFAASCGYPIHVGTNDAGYIRDDLPNEQVSNQQLLERALKGIQGGDIISMHLGIRARQEAAAPILKPLIQGLKARGLCFATLDAGIR
jgi:peptidoglycan/xylan/chitin deacetylase (PgdA/CDA1 family)